ncbi:hypothetical protein [Haloferula rosea]|uniref:Lipoprotein n=1 Tax=Haloferula rosea TaxID=490093 RepID=A0A934REJ2_9BACT|nr:hypothetical protein [Haloferula rosea]MBK1826950.1 hypothetical protein [Haloferula rosea]
MKLKLALLALSLTCATIPFSSCGAVATAAVLNEASNDSERKAFDQGVMMGRKDAKSGRQNNFGKYSTMYNSSTKDAFARGYRSGYASRS